MNTTPLDLLLADDDQDDCMFFREALEELQMSCKLTTVPDGVELMRHLTAGNILPDALFLDLNMPLKNGYECLTEIKVHEKLNTIPIFIYSTSLDTTVVNLLYEKGASYYIRKPGDFSKLKHVIHEALTTITMENPVRTPKEKFVIQVK
jgi:CheY-like chemotaxis protein